MTRYYWDIEKYIWQFEFLAVVFDVGHVFAKNQC